MTATLQARVDQAIAETWGDDINGLSMKEASRMAYHEAKINANAARLYITNAGNHKAARRCRREANMWSRRMHAAYAAALLDAGKGDEAEDRLNLISLLHQADERL
jgi:hypothetical protein